MSATNPTTTWSCPHCAQPLSLSLDSQWACAAGHCFDVAREGYVNLLPTNRGSSREPGDNESMIQARRRTHIARLYEPVADALRDTIGRLQGIATVLDLGCGEGYYSAAIVAASPALRLFGVDISKTAVRLAARHCPQGCFAVASAAAIPLPAGSIDLLASIFAPVAAGELDRLLPANGFFLKVTPAPRHLWELRCALYDRPRPHPAELVLPAGFEVETTADIDYRVTVTPEHLADIIAMTPFAYRGQREKRATLKRAPGLELQMSFQLTLATRIAGAGDGRQPPP
jgi:23S rRNA (guanine745-N1)-methyltransferase